MYSYRNCQINDLNNMCDLWNEVIAEEKFFKEFEYESYKNKLLSNNDFSFDGVFGCFYEEKLIGFGIAYNRKIFIGNENIGGYINTIIINKEYRNLGIGKKILQLLEGYLKECGKKTYLASYYLPSCYEWYIPKTDKHNHPCAPGVRVNSNEYFFLLHNGYETYGFEDAFHLDLVNYELPDSVNQIIIDNKKDGIRIDLYDEKKHFGLDDFYKELKIYDFEKVIKDNLRLDKPYPFLVVSKNEKICGWTGAMYNEDSGRGHFDGIAILNEIRGKGIGNALFCLLVHYSKINGAKFMTFYTGLTNHARYIYMKAGFKIVQTFALMRKKI